MLRDRITKRWLLVCAAILASVSAEVTFVGPSLESTFVYSQDSWSFQVNSSSPTPTWTASFNIGGASFSCAFYNYTTGTWRCSVPLQFLDNTPPADASDLMVEAIDDGTGVYSGPTLPVAVGKVLLLAPKLESSANLSSQVVIGGTSKIGFIISGVPTNATSSLVVSLDFWGPYCRDPRSYTCQSVSYSSGWICSGALDPTVSTMLDGCLYNATAKRYTKSAGTATYGSLWQAVTVTSTPNTFLEPGSQTFSIHGAHLPVQDGTEFRAFHFSYTSTRLNGAACSSLATETCAAIFTLNGTILTCSLLLDPIDEGCVLQVTVDRGSTTSNGTVGTVFSIPFVIAAFDDTFFEVGATSLQFYVSGFIAAPKTSEVSLAYVCPSASPVALPAVTSLTLTSFLTATLASGIPTAADRCNVTAKVSKTLQSTEYSDEKVVGTARALPTPVETANDLLLSETSHTLTIEGTSFPVTGETLSATIVFTGRPTCPSEQFTCWPVQINISGSSIDCTITLPAASDGCNVTAVVQREELVGPGVVVGRAFTVPVVIDALAATRGVALSTLSTTVIISGRYLPVPGEPYSVNLTLGGSDCANSGLVLSCNSPVPTNTSLTCSINAPASANGCDLVASLSRQGISGPSSKARVARLVTTPSVKFSSTALVFAGTAARSVLISGAGFPLAGETWAVDFTLGVTCPFVGTLPLCSSADESAGAIQIAGQQLRCPIEQSPTLDGCSLLASVSRFQVKSAVAQVATIVNSPSFTFVVSGATPPSNVTLGNLNSGFAVLLQVAPADITTEVQSVSGSSYTLVVAFITPFGVLRFQKGNPANDPALLLDMSIAVTTLTGGNFAGPPYETPAAPPMNDGSSSAGAVVGAVIGGLAFAVICMICLALFLRWWSLQRKIKAFRPARQDQLPTMQEEHYSKGEYYDDEYYDDEYYSGEEYGESDYYEEEGEYGDEYYDEDGQPLPPPEGAEVTPPGDSKQIVESGPSPAKESEDEESSSSSGVPDETSSSS